MRRFCMVSCLVVVVLTAGVDDAAGVRGSGALKQRGAELLSRWQQRMGTSSPAKTVVQAGMALTLCTMLACGGVMQSPEVAVPTTQYAEPIGPEPPVKRSVGSIIRTELYGKGVVASRGLTYQSITAYEENKEKLPLQFYDGMMIIQVKDGKDFVRIVDLVDNKILKVRHIGHTSHETVDHETITGVLVGTHPDYGTRYVSFGAEFARPVNNDGGDELLAALPEGTIFYGEPNVIFSNGDYAITVYAFSLVGDQMRNFPREVRFIVNSEHLVTIDRPTTVPQQRGMQPHQRQRIQRNKNNHLLIYYRAADEGVDVSLLGDLDSGVFSSR